MATMMLTVPSMLAMPTMPTMPSLFLVSLWELNSDLHACEIYHTLMHACTRACTHVMELSMLVYITCSVFRIVCRKYSFRGSLNYNHSYFIFIDMSVYSVCIKAHTCHNTHVEVRGQFWRVCFLLSPCGA